VGLIKWQSLAHGIGSEIGKALADSMTEEKERVGLQMWWAEKGSKRDEWEDKIMGQMYGRDTWERMKRRY
jgi:hypothetical protein